MHKTPIKCGVIGHPISHSKSPVIHNHWIALHGLNGTYNAIDVTPEGLKEGIENLISHGYAGFNVTIPYKQAVMALCDGVDNTARTIGAVNTVKIENGKLYGTNTDAFGFLENLKSKRYAIDKTKPAVILGAGGAARAVVYGLLKDGYEHIILTNRTMEKAQEIAEMDKAKITATPWDARHEVIKDAGLLVNTTALGMAGKEPLEIDLSDLSASCVVCDIVYVPLMTELLLQAQARGNPVVTGIGMLLHQARPAFQKWFGVLPDVDDALMRKVLP